MRPWLLTSSEAGFGVLAAAEVAGEVELLVETTATVEGCRGCGVVAEAHGRRPVTVRDLPVGGRPVTVVWLKRLWCCPEPTCPVRTWSETSGQIRPRAVLTERACWWAMRRVGASVCRQLQVGGHPVMRAVRDYGQRLVDDPARLQDVAALGVDEHLWCHAGPTRRTGYATGIVDLTRGRPARLLDVGPGRTGKVYADWIATREAEWRERVRVAALDPLRGYATALSAALPATTRVLDGFHVVKLGLEAVDEVRRRVQHETLGHRGHKGDPLYEVRRRLRRGVETLSDRQRRRLEAAPQIGDPTFHVTMAWQAAQRPRTVYHAPHPAQGRQQALKVLEALPSCPMPEIAQLGRTLRSWRTEFLAYFDTTGASNSPTEAMNLRIEKIRRIGHGYRNMRNYRLRLLLCCGVPWETPHTAQIRNRRPHLVA